MENIRITNYDLDSGIKSIIHNSIGGSKLSLDYTNKIIELYMICLIVKSHITNKVASNNGRMYFNLFISKLLEFNLYGNNTISSISNMNESDLIIYRKIFEDESNKLIDYLNGNEKNYFESIKNNLQKLSSEDIKELIKANFLYHQLEQDDLENLQTFYMTLPQENMELVNIQKDFERLFDYGKITNSSKYGVLETCSKVKAMGTASNMLIIMQKEINELKNHIVNTIKKKHLNGGGRSI